MKPKKIVKRIAGVIIFFTLPTLLLFGFLYFKYNEDLPVGTQGKEADVLATRMLNTLNHDAYKTTDYIEFTFKNRHHYKWNKVENTCEVYWKHIRVSLDLNDTSKSVAFSNEIEIKDIEKTKKLIKKATDYFNNDSFWLVAPYKVFDEGVERRLVTLENNEKALLITYTSGGSTPGDSYLWHFDDSGKPISYQMWTSILPIDGLEASWTDWKTTESGAQLPTFHKLLFLGLEMDDVKTLKSLFQIIKVECETKELINAEEELNDLPKIIETCKFGKFVSISTGNSNYQGKYHYNYKLFKKENDSLIQIKNSDMFNSKIIIMEKMINEETRANYDYLKRIPDLKECVDLIKLKYYSIDDMGITLDDSENITFHINYNLGSACDNVNESIHSFKLKNLEDLFKLKDFLE